MFRVRLDASVWPALDGSGQIEFARTDACKQPQPTRARPQHLAHDHAQALKGVHISFDGPFGAWSLSKVNRQLPLQLD